MEVSERLKFFREKRGLTVNRLANESGVSQSFVRELEQGKKKPTVDTLSALCLPLGITLKEFFDDGEPLPCTDCLDEEIFKLSPEQRKKLAEFLKTIV